MSTIESYIKDLITETGSDILADIFMLKNYPPNFTFGPHRHTRVEINFVKKGKCYMKFDNDVVCFEKNDVMIIYPNVEHYFYVDDKPTTLVQLEFRMETFPDLKVNPELEGHLIFLHNIITNSQKYMKVVYNPEITELIEKIVVEIQEEQENYKVLARLMYSQLFIVISRHIKETLKYTQSLPNDCLNKALKIINTKYNEEIDVEHVASKCFVSSRYLRNLFKKYLNTTPIDYMLSLKINKSKELMRNPVFNLKEIAYQTGFSNQPYFCKRFRDYTGMTPYEYRKTLLR
jgi:AraC-like DNA-binding protein/mannose-6-phosphate isomerase-like protein (cupin superfamily)